MTNRTFTGGWYVCANSKSPYQDAIGKFMSFLCSRKADQIWVTVGEQIPLRHSTLETLSDYISQEGHEWLTAATNLRATAYIAPESMITTGVYMDFQNAFLRAFVEGYSVEEALTSIEQDFIDRNLGR